MNLLLADDHDLVRDSLKVFIERDGEMSVTAVGSLDAAIEMAEAGPVDIAVLDLRMPGMDGPASINRFRAAHPEVPVLLMSGVAAEHEVARAAAAGAAGFVAKSSSAGTLVEAVRQILRGERVFESGIGAPGVGTVGETVSGGRAIALTRRERDVLRQLVRGRSNKEIARDLDLQEVTIKLHLRSVFRKLDVRNRTEAVVAALARGLAEED